MDLCLYAVDHGVGADEVSGVTGLTPEQVSRVFHDIDQKRRTTRYLHLPPQLVEQVLPDHPAGAGDAAVGSANGARKGSPGPTSGARTG